MFIRLSPYGFCWLGLLISFHVRCSKLYQHYPIDLLGLKQEGLIVTIIDIWVRNPFSHTSDIGPTFMHYFPIKARDLVPCFSIQNVHSAFISLVVFLYFQSNSCLESYVKCNVNICKSTFSTFKRSKFKFFVWNL